jgi:hypothetical protein
VPDLANSRSNGSTLFPICRGVVSCSIGDGGIIRAGIGLGRIVPIFQQAERSIPFLIRLDENG